MTRAGKIIVIVGLLDYGAASLAAMVFAHTSIEPFGRTPQLIVSAPWSLGIFGVLEALEVGPADEPWDTSLDIGVVLAGIALNSALFWLFIRWTVGLRPQDDTARAGARMLGCVIACLLVAVAFGGVGAYCWIGQPAIGPPELGGFVAIANGIIAFGIAALSLLIGLIIAAVWRARP